MAGGGGRGVVERILESYAHPRFVLTIFPPRVKMRLFFNHGKKSSIA